MRRVKIMFFFIYFFVFLIWFCVYYENFLIFLRCSITKSQNLSYAYCSVIIGEAICDVEGEDTVAPRTAPKWFQRVNEGDFDLEDRPRSGRPTVLDEEDLQVALDLEPSSNTRELAEELGVDQKTV